MTEETVTPRPTSMDTVNDGIIHGRVQARKLTCEVCGEDTRCLEIIEATMPNGIDEHRTILHKVANDGESGGIITLIGISCGDYAKLHRQVAHIQDKMKARVEVKKNKKGKKSKKRSKGE